MVKKKPSRSKKWQKETELFKSKNFCKNLIDMEDLLIFRLEATSMRVSIQNQEQTKEIQSLLEKLRMSKQW